jgi:hypothetical protein
MDKEITISELERQDAQLLPERETLCLFSGYGPSNWASVTASNQALAFNAGTGGSTATAQAMQSIVVSQ